jgi:hypothetical protein
MCCDTRRPTTLNAPTNPTPTTATKVNIRTPLLLMVALSFVAVVVVAGLVGCRGSLTFGRWAA